jgi:hypothetical protein
MGSVPPLVAVTGGAVAGGAVVVDAAKHQELLSPPPAQLQNRLRAFVQQGQADSDDEVTPIKR